MSHGIARVLPGQASFLPVLTLWQHSPAETAASGDAPGRHGAGTMTLALSIAAIGLFLSAAFSDIATRRIPNRLVALLALVALGRLGLEIAGGAGVLRPAADLALGLAALGFGALLFRFGVVGGGDVKLLAAGALWIGAGSALPYFVGAALAGGALALGFVLWLAASPPGAIRPSLPYGVAIAAGGVIGTLATL